MPPIIGTIVQGYIYLRNRDDSKHDPLVTAANSFRAQTYPVKTVNSKNKNEPSSRKQP